MKRIMCILAILSAGLLAWSLLAWNLSADDEGNNADTDTDILLSTSETSDDDDDDDGDDEDQIVLTPGTRRYYGYITNIADNTYDGDTIQDVSVDLPVCVTDGIDGEELWPGIVQSWTSVFVVTDLRIAGIDAPEHRQSTKLPEDVRQANKKKAADSEAYLESLLSNSVTPGVVVIENPIQGSFGGRTVVDVFVTVWLDDEGDLVELTDAEGILTATLTEIDIAAQMLAAGHAEVYQD